MKKVFFTIVASIVVAGAITVAACSKDNEPEQIVKPTILPTKGSGTFDKLQQIMLKYYTACDNAYHTDSVAILKACEVNNAEHFTELIGLSEEEIIEYSVVAMKEAEEYSVMNPGFIPEKNPCINCDQNALQRIGKLLSLSAGHMAALMPIRISEDDRIALEKCIGRCKMQTTPCGVTACLSACMGEYNYETYSVLLKPMNRENPYDNAGIWHNKILSESNNRVMKTYNESGDISMAGSIAISNNLLSYMGYDTIGNGKSTLQIWKDLDNYFAKVIRDECDNEIVYNMLIDVVYKMYDMACEGENNYDAYRTMIENAESDAIKSQVLTDNNLVIFLTSTSVLRHSLYYWSEYDFNSVPAKKLPGWVKAVVTVAADVAGAVEGAVSGAVAGAALGSAVPGVGTAAGAAAGAIAGSINKSISSSGSALAMSLSIDKALEEKKPVSDSIKVNVGN